MKQVKFYNRKINTVFHDIGIPKNGCPCICSSLILIHSVSKQIEIIILKSIQKTCQRKKEKNTLTAIMS